jgi:hypothetical protein
LIKDYRTKAILGLTLGVSLGLLANFVEEVIERRAAWEMGPPLIPAVMQWSGAGTFIAGCVMYALAKGRSGWWGAFGLLSLLGLLVLLWLEDRARHGYAAGPRGFEPVMPEEPAPPRM